jgi:toxin ParE1/3/4
MKVRWSRLVIEDLLALRARITEDNPAAAQKIARIITSSVQKLLCENAEIGRPGRVPGTRELVIARTPYIVPYCVRRGVIHVLRVYHGKRRRPDKL